MGTKISDLPADSSVTGVEVIPATDGATTKKITTAALAAYAIDTLAAASAATPTTGDKLAGFRSSTEKLLDLDAVSSYAVASGWSVATEADPAASGDMILAQRGSTVYKVDVDTLSEFVLAGVQADVLDISALSAATLGATDQLLVCQTTTAKKTTLSALETKLWADLLTHVSGLTAATAAADADLIHIIQGGGTERLVTPKVLADYMTAEIAADILATAWDAAEIDPAVSGDMLIAERSNVLKTIDIDTISDYAIAALGATAKYETPADADDLILVRGGVPGTADIEDVAVYANAAAWANAAVVTTLVAGDTILLDRSASTKEITLANVAAGIRSTVLDISGLSAASLGSTDQILIVQSTTALKTTLADVETKLWADFATYAAALTDAGTVADADEFYILAGGSAAAPKNATAKEIATYMTAEIGADIISAGFDSATVTAASGDLVLAERSNVTKTIDVDTIGARAIALLGASAKYDTPADLDDVLLVRGGVPGPADIEDVAAYVLDTVWDAAADTPAAGDLFLFGKSNVMKKVTLANLETQITTDITATVRDISGLSQATLGATDTFMVNQAGTSLKTTLTALETKLHADFATYAAALTDAATVGATDEFYILAGGSAAAPKNATALEIATYVTGAILASAAVTPAAAGDKIVVSRSDVAGTMDIDVLTTYVLASAQATVLDISGLTAETIGSTDTMLICQGTTPAKTTVALMTAAILGELDTFTDALSAVAEPADADNLFCSQSGTGKKLALSDLAAYVLTNAQTLPWTTVLSSKYTATPTTTSTLAMSDTSDMKVGLPVKYTYNSATYYGIVTAVAANTSITIAGAPLNLSYPLTALSVGIPEQVCQVDLCIQHIYDAAVQDILSAVEERYFKWQKAKAYLVGFSVTQHWPDSGATQPYVNVKIAGNLVSTNSSSQGVQVSATPGTWTDNSAVAVSAANYEIERGDALDIRCTVGGTNGNAECLTVSCVFVYE